MGLTIQTHWRSEDWLDVLKEEVEPHFKHITFERCDHMGQKWNPSTKSYDPLRLDYVIMIVVDDGAEDYLKEHFLTTLKTKSGYTNTLELDLERGISQWIAREIGHRLW